MDYNWLTATFLALFSVSMWRGNLGKGYPLYRKIISVGTAIVVVIWVIFKLKA